MTVDGVQESQDFRVIDQEVAYTLCKYLDTCYIMDKMGNILGASDLFVTNETKIIQIDVVTAGVLDVELSTGYTYRFTYDSKKWPNSDTVAHKLRLWDLERINRERPVSAYARPVPIPARPAPAPASAPTPPASTQSAPPVRWVSKFPHLLCISEETINVLFIANIDEIPEHFVLADPLDPVQRFMLANDADISIAEYEITLRYGQTISKLPLEGLVQPEDNAPAKSLYIEYLTHLIHTL